MQMIIRLTICLRTADTIDEVTKLLERDSTMLFKWFSDNQMKANISKCHLLVNTKDEVVTYLGDSELKIVSIKNYLE